MLTDREVEVLWHAANGYEYKEIAERLSISRITVRKHLQNIRAKLNTCNTVHAVYIAVSKGYIPVQGMNIRHIELNAQKYMARIHQLIEEYHKNPNGACAIRLPTEVIEES